jgi:hypothetical protein
VIPSVYMVVPSRVRSDEEVGDAVAAELEAPGVGEAAS